MLAGAVVLGDIISRKVQIEDMTTFNGRCISIKDDELFEKESDKYLQSKAIKDKVVLA